MTQTRVYLDAGGRAPLHPAAREALLTAMDDGWADPRRLHSEGRRARLLLDGARAEIATALGCRFEEIHLTPGHTASLHAAVLSVAAGRRRVGGLIVTSAVERAAVLAAARHVDEQSEPVPVDAAARVDLDAWAMAVARPGVALAALQHANGEVGTRQPLQAAHEACVRAGVPLLVDAGASIGHDAVGPTWDVLAADPADWGGAAGVGVLAVRSTVRTRPVGPEDEDPWAPGGVGVPQAAAAAAALLAVLADRAEAAEHRHRLIDRLRTDLARVPDLAVLGDPHDRLPHVMTFSCLFVDGESLVDALDRQGFAVGSGSACTASTLEPSHVLAAMGALTHGNVRVALPRGASPEDVERFGAAVGPAVAGVRSMLGAGGL